MKMSEIDEIVDMTTFNGQSLIDGTYSNTTFQTGEQASETLAVALGNADSSSIGVGSISLATQASANTAMTTINNSIDTLEIVVKSAFKTLNLL